MTSQLRANQRPTRDDDVIERSNEREAPLAVSEGRVVDVHGDVAAGQGSPCVRDAHEEGRL